MKECRPIVFNASVTVCAALRPRAQQIGKLAISVPHGSKAAGGNSDIRKAHGCCWTSDTHPSTHSDDCVQTIVIARPLAEGRHETPLQNRAPDTDPGPFQPGGGE